MGLHVAVVGLDGVDDFLGLLILAGDVDADGHVAALDLVVDGLADIVQEAGALGGGHVDAELGSEQAGNVRNLDGVVEHILAVTGAVLHAAEQLDELGMQAVDVCLENGALALGLDGGVDLLLGLGDHFLDAGGVDASVLNELFERDARDFAPHGVEARERDGLGRVVDDEVAAGERLDGADVAALAADDAALHLVVRQRHDRHGHFAGMVGGAALDGGGDDLAGAGIGLILVLGLDLLDHECLLMHDVVLQAVDEEGLGLLDRIAGDLLEQLHLGLFELIDLILLGVDRGDLLVEGIRLFVERVRFAVEGLLLLLEAALLLLQLRAAFLDLAFILRPALVDLFLGLEQGLTPLALGTLIGIIYDLLGLLFRTADLALRDLFAVKPAKDTTNHKRCDDTTECYW